MKSDYNKDWVVFVLKASACALAGYMGGRYALKKWAPTLFVPSSNGGKDKES